MIFTDFSKAPYWDVLKPQSNLKTRAWKKDIHALQEHGLAGYLLTLECISVKTNRLPRRYWSFLRMNKKYSPFKSRAHTHCYRLNICVPICWSIIPIVIGIRRWGFWEVTRSWRQRSHTERSISPSDMLRPQCYEASMNQEVALHQTLNLPVPWSWTAQPPELWYIKVCCLGHPVCGSLL